MVCPRLLPSGAALPLPHFAPATRPHASPHLGASAPHPLLMDFLSGEPQAHATISDRLHYLSACVNGFMFTFKLLLMPVSTASPQVPWEQGSGVSRSAPGQYLTQHSHSVSVGGRRIFTNVPLIYYLLLFTLAQI